ncbi:MAG: GNAT family N-acetyltransferase [Rickettsiales bacterium]|nr:GNAT family N-acetyltransferase [Rickettsiales bacterium]
MSQPDHLHALGFLALGSRLKRISDTLYGSTSEFYAANHIDFEPSCFPLLSLLDQEHEVSMSDAASALGVSAASVSQKASILEKNNILSYHTHADDKRAKVMRLTAEGKALVKRLQPMWYAIRQTQQEIGAELPYSLLALLDNYERAITDASLPQRMADHQRHYYSERIRIHDYSEELAPYFASINKAWIEELFKLEPHDEKVMNDPKKYIIDNGGMVYFAEIDGQILGTAALYKEEDGHYEFTKMGTTGNVRGKGIGRALLRHVIDDAKTRLDAKRIFILSSRSLHPACHLYRSMGFVDIPLTKADTDKYQRADIKLELWLDADAEAEAKAKSLAEFEAVNVA